ncbi:alpha/beta hydrolase domain-containing protein [Umezawaea beigongshangensis]|uniref:alpha/beta hydrolase domain-containing protein n=1 Tax=Umezawaea beigongshangensis TaxID=2780383 RepID=UPI0018F161FD|nr:alpha/beta hydrolase domain-containing protein [Umezawaea beigongshangensis]
MRRSAVLLALLTLVLTGAPAVAAASGTTLTRIAPDAGRGHPVAGVEGVLDLPGYTEQEFLLSGEADTYEQVGTWSSDGRWEARVSSTGNDFTTRLLVERPRDPARFNGVVVVEWLNVSFGVDIPVDLSQSWEHFVRRGYAYVGVTAQKVGADRLTALDPARYGDVSLSDDSLSYDVFGQAARAVRTQPRLLGGLHARTVLATGHSQSAGRLVTHLNAVQPLRHAFDGALVHGRGPTAAPIATGAAPVPSALIRDDQDVPAFVVQAETDVLAPGAVHQNARRVRTWEVAGTAHADRYGLDLYNALNARDGTTNGGAPTTCAAPVNDMTHRYAQNAAYEHLLTWVRRGEAPPVAPPITKVAGVVQRDADGNALGGVRLPDLDVPVARYSPTGTGGNVPGACLLLGATTPFTAERLAALYEDHTAYTSAFRRAAASALRSGYLLPADFHEAVARAEAAPVP